MFCLDTPRREDMSILLKCGSNIKEKKYTKWFATEIGRSGEGVYFRLV